MKNEAEEKAIAFVRELQEKLINSNHSGFYIINEILGVAHKSFMVGYNEVMRWRDPKIELPEINSRVLLKSETGYVEARTIRNWHILKSTLNVSIGGKKVIGWRPIE